MNAIIIILIIYILLNKNGYYPYYPPLINISPDSVSESNIVKYYCDNKSNDDISFFKLTDDSIVIPFLPYVNENKDELISIVADDIIVNLIKLLKITFNRPRPYQVRDIDYLYSGLGLTPSFPAGHAFQAHYLAKILSKKYPHHKKIFYDISIQCDICRVKAGIHYPSDGVFSRKIVDFIFD